MRKLWAVYWLAEGSADDEIQSRNFVGRGRLEPGAAVPKGALSNKVLSLSQEGTLVAFQKPEQHRQTMRGQSQVSAGKDLPL